jgi:GTP-binding protein
MFFDATQSLSKVDKQLCSYIAEEFKPCIFVVNKWDLVHGQLPTERWVRHLRESLRSMWHVPIAFVTGQTGKNVKALLNHAQMLFKQSLDRIGTGELNRLIRGAIEAHQPPSVNNLTPKIYYATQVSSQPPTMVLICNEPRAFAPSYRRYLLGVLRDQLSFGEVPIKLYLKKRRPADRRDEINFREGQPLGDEEGFELHPSLESEPSADDAFTDDDDLPVDFDLDEDSDLDPR